MVAKNGCAFNFWFELLKLVIFRLYAVFVQVQFMCVEWWPSSSLDLTYTVCLFLLIVLFPSSAMALMYYFVAKALSSAGTLMHPLNTNGQNSLRIS